MNSQPYNYQPQQPLFDDAVDVSSWHRYPAFEWNLRTWQFGASICFGPTTRGGFIALGPLFLQLSWGKP